MSKSVQLPIAEPLYSTYHYQGNSGAILTENMSIRNWFLNRVMNLSCSRLFLYGYTSPFVSVKDSSDGENPYIEKISFSMRYLDSDIHRVIRRLIDDGYYVSFSGVDDYYVKGKTWYHEKHFIHDGLICGYDQNDKTYTIYAYDKSWVYRTFKTPQRAFEAGRRASLADGFCGTICAMKVKSENVELRPEEICKCLKEYMNSSLNMYPLYSDGMVYGSAVQDYVAMYMNKLADQTVPYERTDRRVFRMLWEHKKVMLERIVAVENKLKMNREISSQYADIVKEADALRMMYASHRMKARYPILLTIRDRLILLKETENRLLTGFIEKMDGAM